MKLLCVASAGRHPFDVNAVTALGPKSNAVLYWTRCYGFALKGLICLGLECVSKSQSELLKLLSICKGYQTLISHKCPCSSRLGSAKPVDKPDAFRYHGRGGGFKRGERGDHPARHVARRCNLLRGIGTWGKSDLQKLHASNTY